MWKAANLIHGSLATVSCATSRLCVAIDSTGDVFSSIDPTAGASAWTTVNITGGVALAYNPTVYDNAVPDDISCPTTRLCVTSDTTASIQFSTDPGWQAAQAAKPRLGNGSLAGASRRKARLAFTLSAGIPPGKAIRRITVAPPGGIGFPRGRASLLGSIVVKGRGEKRVNFTSTVSQGVLTIRLKHAAPKVEMTIAAPAISVSRKLSNQVKHKTVKVLTFELRASDAGNTTTELPLRVRPS
jgi:hypothetical protein